MSETSNNNLKIKISPNPKIQKLVEAQEDIIKKFSPEIDDKTKNIFARTAVAKNLKLDKRAMEIEKAKEISGIDSLTGLHNHKWFTEQLKMKIAEANRNNQTFKLIGFDLDHFKWINDTYGHIVGDEILRCVKHISTRTEEPICRDGGEEFKQILDAENTSDVEIMTVRLMNEMETLSTAVLRNKKAFPNIPNVEISEVLRRVTLSIGVSEYIPGTPMEDFLQTVDKAQYRAKQTGRNRAVYGTKISQDNYNFKELQRKPVSKAMA
jgi:diguanylate cyclase (GGDEF)-like protein